MRQLMQALWGLVGRGRVTRAKSSSAQQQVQVVLSADELKDSMEHMEPFGFTSCPKPDAEALALFLGGDRSNGVVIMVSDRSYRLKGLAEGESALYNAAGHTVVLYQDRIEITAPQIVFKASAEVVADTPLFRTTGAINAAADITDNAGSGGSTMAALRTAHNDHAHAENNNTGGKTEKADIQV